MDLVGSSVLPFVFFAVRRGTCLMLVWLFAVAVVTLTIAAAAAVFIGFLAVSVLVLGVGRHVFERVVVFLVRDNGYFRQSGGRR